MNYCNEQYSKRHSLELSMADLQELTGGHDIFAPIQSGLEFEFDEDLDKLFMSDGDPSEKCLVKCNEADNTEGNAPFHPYFESNTYHDTVSPHSPSKQCDSLSAREQPAASFTQQHSFTHTLSENPRVLSDANHLNEDISENQRLLSHSTRLSADMSGNTRLLPHSMRLSEKIFSLPPSRDPPASHFSLPFIVRYEVYLQNLVQLMQKSEKSRRDCRKVKMHMKREQQGVKKNYQDVKKGISYADIKWSRSKKRYKSE